MKATGAISPASPRFARALRPFQQFAKSESAGAIVLLGTAATALAWANSPWSASYFYFWNAPIAVGPASHPMTLSLQQWINDGLMTVFFLAPSAGSRLLLLALSNPNLYRLFFEPEVTNRDLNSTRRRRVQPFSCSGVPRSRSWGVAEQSRLGLYKRTSKKGAITP
jgi:hypothetical protein